MTTADERLRNWIWGREMLAELAQDESLPSETRSLASSLLQQYPGDDLLRSFLTTGWPTVPHETDAVLTSTRLLFLQLQQQPFSSTERCHALGVILRHFDY
jgi:hypothetical protein